jgi:hypothetical protein
MTRLFIYGTLLAPHIQQELFGRLINGPVAEVPGTYVDYSEEYPRLMSTPVFGAAALGRVIELNSDELSAACAFEGPTYWLAEIVLSDLSTVHAFM